METAPENQSKINDHIQEDNDSTESEINAEPLPIPEDGLPEGWDEEQWQHYGQQYLDSI